MSWQILDPCIFIASSESHWKPAVVCSAGLAFIYEQDRVQIEKTSERIRDLDGRNAWLPRIEGDV